MHRFYVNSNNIQGNIAIITGQDAKHLVNVLRLVEGFRVHLTDGQGTYYLSEIENITTKKVVFKIIDKTFLLAESPAHITIAQGMLRDKKMDIILRHLTELGIKEWIPFFASRSIPRSDIRHKNIDVIKKTSDVIKKITDGRVDRWERIARESIKQCGRSLVPLIHNPMEFEQMLSESGSYDKKIVFWENAIMPVDQIREEHNLNKQEKLKEHQPQSNRHKIIIIIGPEGGFSEQDIDIIQKRGFNAFSLGNRILRVETATIAACTLIQNIFGDIGTKI